MSEISRVKLFGKLNSIGYKAIESATVFCKMRGNPYVELVHWLHQILQLQDSDLHRIIKQFNVDPSRLAKDMTEALDRLPRGSTSISDLSSHIEQAVERGFAAVCVNPWLVENAARVLSGTDIAVCSVAGFPLGAGTAWTKSTEAQGAIADGAAEVDLVINVGALKSGEPKTADQEISLVRRSIGDAVLKVILEVPLLDDKEIEEGCRIAIGCGADFIKTCTGFGPRGVEVSDVIKLPRLAGPAVGVKAAGGITTLGFARELVAAGATRLGSSSGVQIAEEESRVL